MQFDVSQQGIKKLFCPADNKDVYEIQNGEKHGARQLVLKFILMFSFPCFGKKTNIEW